MIPIPNGAFKGRANTDNFPLVGLPFLFSPTCSHTLSFIISLSVRFLFFGNFSLPTRVPYCTLATFDRLPHLSPLCTGYKPPVDATSIQYLTEN